MPKFLLLAAAFPILWNALKPSSKVIKAKIIALFFIAIGLGDFLCNQLKYLFLRLRPADELSWFESGYKLSYSFPSNHAFNWFMASTFLFLLYKNTLLKSPLVHRIVFLGAIGISLSRVLTGRHFPLDVIGGFVLGTLFTAILYMIMNKSLLKTSNNL
jgi:undecaprenyl-diphosphatase